MKKLYQLHLSSTALLLGAVLGFGLSAGATTTINVNFGGVAGDAMNGKAFIYTTGANGPFQQAPAHYSGTTWNDFIQADNGLGGGSPPAIGAANLLDSGGNPTTVGWTDQSTDTPTYFGGPATWYDHPDATMQDGGLYRVYNSGSGNIMHNRLQIYGLIPNHLYNIYLACSAQLNLNNRWGIGTTNTAPGATQDILNSATYKSLEQWGPQGDNWLVFYNVQADAGGYIFVWGYNLVNSSANNGLTLNGFQVVDANGWQNSDTSIYGFGSETVGSTFEVDKNGTGTNLVWHLPWGTSLTALSPTFTLADFANASPASGSTHDFSSPVNYTVTAQDGSTRVYHVTTLLGSPAKDLLSCDFGQLFLSVGDTNDIYAWPSGNNATVLTCYVLTGTDVSSLTPTNTVSDFATIAPTGPQNFTSPVQYTVTAQDGSTKVYTIQMAFASTRVIPISTTYTPGPSGPSQGIMIDTTVTNGNIGLLVGSCQTFWNSGGFTVPLMLNGYQLIVDSGGGNAMNARGPVSGAGSVRVNAGGIGITYITGSTASSYTGTTLLNNGPVSLGNTSSNALCGTITVQGTESTSYGGYVAPGIGNVIWTASDQIADTADISVVTSGAWLNLAGHTDTIHSLSLAAGTHLETGAGGVLKVATLFTNGVQLPNGVAFGPGSGFVTGSGYIDVGNSGPPVIATIPAGPSGPVPTNNATGIHPMMLTKLDWADSLGASSYDLYFWLAGDTKPATPTASGALSEYALTLPLVSNTNYNWQVVATNAVGPTNGPVWTFATTDRSHVSNVLTPANPPLPSDGVNIDYIVGVTNSAVLVGFCQTHWAVHGFTVPVNLNGNTLAVNSGGGNVPYGAYGPISGTGTVTYNTVTAPNTKISVSGNNTYSGTTTVERGWISLENTTGGDAMLGAINVGTLSSAVLAWTANNQINDNADVTLVTAGSYLELAGFNDTIRSLTLPFGTYVDTDNMGGASPAGVLTVSSLTLGGSPQPPGTYDVSAAPDYILGYGSIVVVAAAPPFPASGFTMPGGVPTFQVPTELGKTYTLFYKDNLTDATWTALTGSGTGAGTGSPITLSDPTVSLPAQRFYRLGAQ